MNASPRSVHLVHGPTAAGKSTYARGLAEDVKGVRFAIDEWMHALFGADLPEQMDMAWVMPRVARCQAQMWSVAGQILASGTDVVLELGLIRRADRIAFADRVAQSGHVAVSHYIDADLNTRRKRVLNRNAEKGASYSFEVTPIMFDAIESCFECPDALELSGMRVRRGQPS